MEMLDGWGRVGVFNVRSTVPAFPKTSCYWWRGDIVKIQCDLDDEARLMVTVVIYLVKLIDLW